MRCFLIFAGAWVLTVACHAQSPHYDVLFEAEISPQMVEATIRLGIQTDVVKALNFAASADKYELVDYTGEIEQTDTRIIWTPPPKNGFVRYRYSVNNKRGTGYDARLTEKGLVARLGDIFPRATVRTSKGAKSVSSLRLTSPSGWSFESRYGKVDGTVSILSEGRNFTRPTGWLVGGELATRREVIGDRRIATSALSGDGARQMEMLTFLRWTLPVVLEVLPDFPERILIAVGGEDMWRGALSAPNSLYVQKNRPLVSGNGTSTVVHELFHVGGLHSAADQDDWIVEGLAEYYSLEVLRRSGGLSQERFQIALDKLQQWVDEEDGQLASPSKGADTAYAVLLFVRLAEELRQAGQDLDQVTAMLASDGEISRKRLSEICESLLGKRSRMLVQSLGT